MSSFLPPTPPYKTPGARPSSASNPSKRRRFMMSTDEDGGGGHDSGRHSVDMLAQSLLNLSSNDIFVGEKGAPIVCSILNGHRDIVTETEKGIPHIDAHLLWAEESLDGSIERMNILENAVEHVQEQLNITEQQISFVRGRLEEARTMVEVDRAEPAQYTRAVMTILCRDIDFEKDPLKKIQKKTKFTSVSSIGSVQDRSVLSVFLELAKDGGLENNPEFCKHAEEVTDKGYYLEEHHNMKAGKIRVNSNHSLPTLQALIAVYLSSSEWDDKYDQGFRLHLSERLDESCWVPVQGVARQVPGVGMPPSPGGYQTPQPTVSSSFMPPAASGAPGQGGQSLSVTHNHQGGIFPPAAAPPASTTATVPGLQGAAPPTVSSSVMPPAVAGAPGQGGQSFPVTHNHRGIFTPAAAPPASTTATVPSSQGAAPPARLPSRSPGYPPEFNMGSSGRPARRKSAPKPKSSSPLPDEPMEDANANSKPAAA